MEPEQDRTWTFLNDFSSEAKKYFSVHNFSEWNFIFVRNKNNSRRNFLRSNLNSTLVNVSRIVIFSNFCFVFKNLNSKKPRKWSAICDSQYKEKSYLHQVLWQEGEGGWGRVRKACILFERCLIKSHKSFPVTCHKRKKFLSLKVLVEIQFFC